MAATFEDRIANVATLCGALGAELAEIDPAVADLYRTTGAHLAYLTTPARALAYAEDLEQRSTDLDADDATAQRLVALAGRLRTAIDPTRPHQTEGDRS